MFSASSQSYPVSGLQLHFVSSLPLLGADSGDSAQTSRNLLQLMSSSAPEVLCSVLFADWEAFLLEVFLLFLCILISSVCIYLEWKWETMVERIGTGVGEKESSEE